MYQDRRKFLIVSSDVKLNNRIIEILEQETNGQMDYKELSFIEDINEVIFEYSAEKIFIYEEVETEEGYTNLQKDIYFYDYILNELKGLDIVLLTDKLLTDRLNAKLIESGFYSICPISRLEEYLLKPPRSLEGVKKAFSDQLYMDNIGTDQMYKPSTHGKDSFKVPPTRLTVQPKIRPFMDQMDETYSSSSIHPSEYDNAQVKEALRLHSESNRPIVSVYWSPIPNVGVSSLIKATALSLARKGRKVLIMELDLEYPKIARTTYLTHRERHILRAFQAILNNEPAIEDNIVNNQIAIDDLPYRILNQAKPSLRQLPESLYVLSRNAEVEFVKEPNIEDDRFIEKLFFQARQAGFHNILVDVPSNPSNLLTTLALLGGDERFLVVDDSNTTAYLFRNALEVLKKIDISENDFQLIVNKVSDRMTESDISSLYIRTPILSLPFCEEITLNQRDLLLEGGMEYMNAIENFIIRYGVENNEDTKKKKKRFTLFGA